MIHLLYAIVCAVGAIGIAIALIAAERQNRSLVRRVAEMNRQKWEEDDAAGRPRRPGLDVI